MRRGREEKDGDRKGRKEQEQRRKERERKRIEGRTIAKGKERKK